MYLKGMWTSDRETEQKKGEEETDRTDNETDDQLIQEVTVVNITLGTGLNAPLDYTPGLETNHLIMSKLEKHREQ